jgi:hypothetical protein
MTTLKGPEKNRRLIQYVVVVLFINILLTNINFQQGLTY